MARRKRNPNQFTTDEAQTATLLVTEGSVSCVGVGKYRYPRLEIIMCDKEALQPAARVLKTRIGKRIAKKVVCPPHMFPPDGKGMWRVVKVGRGARRTVQHLDPLLTSEFKRKWKRKLQEC